MSFRKIISLNWLVPIMTSHQNLSFDKVYLFEKIAYVYKDDDD
jgi:hypothetical protein